jgi:hypothetical protein
VKAIIEVGVSGVTLSVPDWQDMTNLSLLLFAAAVALLRSLSENPGMKTSLSSGWEATWELCVGAPSSETFWTGIECLDYVNKPGVVGQM